VRRRIQCPRRQRRRGHYDFGKVPWTKETTLYRKGSVFVHFHLSGKADNGTQFTTDDELLNGSASHDRIACFAGGSPRRNGRGFHFGGLLGAIGRARSPLRNRRNRRFTFSDKTATKAETGNDKRECKGKIFYDVPLCELSVTERGTRSKQDPTHVLTRRYRPPN
jgi:hypothetical protein